MTSQAVTYVAMVAAVENDDLKALKRLLATGADVNANLDDDIGIWTVTYNTVTSSEFELWKLAQNSCIFDLLHEVIEVWIL